MDSPYIEDVFGQQAIELAGRAIRPEYQQQQIGSKLLGIYLRSNTSAYVATYTRNPSVIRMIQRQQSVEQVYPLDNADGLKQIAIQMPFAKEGDDGVMYHIGRYGEDGLYGANDPATHPDNKEFLEKFRQLKVIGNALIVIGRRKIV